MLMIKKSFKLRNIRKLKLVQKGKKIYSWIKANHQEIGTKYFQLFITVSLNYKVISEPITFNFCDAQTRKKRWRIKYSYLTIVVTNIYKKLSADADHLSFFTEEIWVTYIF